MLALDGESLFRVAALQCRKCRVPSNMAMQGAGAVIAGQPTRNQPFGLLACAASSMACESACAPLALSARRAKPRWVI
jgi:hypothetical protein